MVTDCPLAMSDVLGKHYVTPVLVKLYKGQAMMTELTPIVSNYSTLRLLIRDLQDAGYVTTKEVFQDKRKIMVSLTPKGRAVAEQLKRAEEVATQGYSIDEEKGIIAVSDEAAQKWYEKFKEATRGLSLLYHVNVYADHVTIAEKKDGKTRITNIYVRVNGRGVLRLWCELDESFECSHVEYAWTLPEVQEMFVNNVRNGNVKEKV